MNNNNSNRALRKSNNHNQQFCYHGQLTLGSKEALFLLSSSSTLWRISGVMFLASKVAMSSLTPRLARKLQKKTSKNCKWAGDNLNHWKNGSETNTIKLFFYVIVFWIDQNILIYSCNQMFAHLPTFLTVQHPFLNFFLWSHPSLNTSLHPHTPFWWLKRCWTSSSI